MNSHQSIAKWLVVGIVIVFFLFQPMIGVKHLEAQSSCPNGAQRQWLINQNWYAVERCVCTGSGPFRKCEWKKIMEIPVPPTPTGPAPTWTPSPTSAPTVTPSPTPTATRITVRSVTQSVSIADFEDFGIWRRGDEQYGTLTETAEQKSTGRRAAKLEYSFPAGVRNNYVVFRRTIPIEIVPDALRVQVYGDGSSHFLNVWLQDAKNQLWQFTFGRITHAGWQLMEAPVGGSQAWPNGPIGNVTTESPVAPLRFYALVLDGYTSDRSFEGTIYLDDLDAISYQEVTGNRSTQSTASTQSGTIGKAIINSTTLNVRSGPGTAYGVVTKVNQGEVYPILSRDTASGWVQLAIGTAPTGVGWVSGQYIRISSDNTSVFPPDSVPSSSSPAPQILVTDFETFGTWQRGDEPWGTFVQSTEQKQSGRNAGKFTYDFPAGEPNNYIVFHRTISIAGQPTALRLQVYGDSSTHFLNAWVQDARGQLWQFTFGRINHSGWQSMEAPLDLGAGWPNGAIGHSATSVAYPIKLYALILDGYTSEKAFTGFIYVDDLVSVSP